MRHVLCHQCPIIFTFDGTSVQKNGEVFVGYPKGRNVAKDSICAHSLRIDIYYKARENKAPTKWLPADLCRLTKTI